jgi:hypothetical protein
MNEADKLNLGIKVKDSTNTPKGKPESECESRVQNTSGRFEKKVTCVCLKTGQPKKPDDAYGVRYAWMVVEPGAPKPASGEHLSKSRFKRRTHWTIPHTEEDNGKTGYYATCYENRRGEQGPWSAIVEAVIG